MENSERQLPTNANDDLILFYIKKYTYKTGLSLKIVPFFIDDKNMRHQISEYFKFPDYNALHSEK